jgi:alkylation response protein AidB-like acyl-CoA dehydrogenase
MMLPPWLDRVHHQLWRIENDSQLLALEKRARCAAAAAVPKLDALPDDLRWNDAKVEILSNLHDAGLLTLLNSERPSTTALSVVFFELARIDGGLATLALSGCLPQMPIAEFGSDEQKAQYLGRLGALCLTEPLPGAGAEALLLTGRFRPSAVESDAEPWIEVEKRGRFTSHMEFAEFVVAAVEGEEGARGSALVILEPGDAGIFDRGSAVRKIGHRLSSTTNPIFQLRVPVSRIVGGFEIESGVLRPRVDHRRALNSALQRTRALLALTTAAKAFAALNAISEWAHGET